MPNCVNLKTAHRMMVKPKTMPTEISWSSGTVTCAGQLDAVLGQLRRQREGGGAEALDDDGLQHDEHTDRGHDLGQRRRAAQRPEDEEVQDQADDRGDQQRQRSRRARRTTVRRRRPWSASPTGARPSRRACAQMPSMIDNGLGSGGMKMFPVRSQVHVDVGRVHGDGATGEVDHARALEGEHHPQRDRCDQRARGDAEDQGSS